jgi:hypothetical protein
MLVLVFVVLLSVPLSLGSPLSTVDAKAVGRSDERVFEWERCGASSTIGGFPFAEGAVVEEDVGGAKDLDGGMTPALFARSMSFSSSSSQNAALSSENFLVRVGVLFR